MKKAILSVLLSVLVIGATTVAKATKPDNLVMIDSNTIQVVGVIDDAMVSKVQERVMTSNQNSITFYIKSPGGSIDAGNNLIQVIKATGKKTRCVVDFAASMAFVFTQLACDERMILPMGTLMQHQAAYGLSQQPAERQKSMVKMIDHIVETLEKQQAVRLGISLEEFQKRRNNDYWLIGEQAVTDRAADKVTFALCTPALVKQRVRETQQVFVFTVEVERSACPLLNDAKVVPSSKEETKKDAVKR